jgi:large subunit ribosomal protein L15
MATTKTKESLKVKQKKEVKKEETIELNNLQPYEDSTKKRKRIGRGNASGYGGECGRGHKGQKSRSGFSRKRGFEGGQNPLYRRVPKKRGFHNIFKKKIQLINIENINYTKFSEEIELKHLIDANLVKDNLPIKLVGNLPEGFKLKSIETNLVSKPLQKKLEEIGCKIIFSN